MGLEAQCKACLDGIESSGKLLLETDVVIYRGAKPLKIAIPSLTSVSVAGSNLRLLWPGHEASFELGEKAAEKWRSNILNPKSILEKLGVKPGLKVAAFHITDQPFLDSLQVLPDCRDLDLLFLGIEKVADLDTIPEYTARLQPSGALWTVYPKGRKDLTQNHVMSAARSQGLIDIKVAAFSATHTALKWKRRS